MSISQVVRGPLLNPRPDGSVQFVPDGVLAGDERGRIVAVGDWSAVRSQVGSALEVARTADGLILPPMLDAHIHIPQHPIRGRFLEGVTGRLEEGSLLAGLNRNVFPTEGQCADDEVARRVVEAFRADTLAHGVVGGAAYMTVHTAATRTALASLGDEWHVGLVLMQRNCPAYLRTDEAALEIDVANLAGEFGRRLIVTDRFAGAVDSLLRRRGVALSQRYGLRMQTHLNEQFAEKAWIEGLYPAAKNYTDIYRGDGLLDCTPIVAHCLRMGADEFDMLAAATGTAVAHCPVSNTLLGSGVMPLDELIARGIPYAICTDVGASPTTSLLCEMMQFLRVHAGRSRFATPQEALFRTTLAPAQILGVDDRIGSFDIGKELSFVEVASSGGRGWTDQREGSPGERATDRGFAEAAPAPATHR
ncbi:MAG: amidohydrolase family protein, partial [Planctomycetaceae bacterium]|nr:amidohydrolase family protein [Planctomycetaceae bacterium]